ncbi:MAG: hypothetical protein ABSG41_20365 [Bryobacteraceae bacterium]
MHNLVQKTVTLVGASGLSPLNLCIIAVVLAFFWLYPAVFRRMFRRCASVSGMFDRHRAATVLLVALVPIAGRLLLLSSHPVPVPRIPDEFSYLLASDTFSQGRVTNPAHPLWQFFETIHVLPFPTYMSKYPPAQGLLLAAGQVLFGHPWWGVVLSIGLMVGSVCWMLQGWLPGRWAALGALATGLQFGIGHAWMNSYWGGAPAAIGACIVLGALARLKQFRPFPCRPVRYSLLFALGIVILLNSRPWEGMAVIVPAAIAVLLWMFGRSGTQLFERVRAVLVPASVLLLVGATAMSYYNWRVTGNPLHLPYTTIHKTYSVVPLFVWQSSTPAPSFRHTVLKRYFLETEPHYQAADTLGTLRGWAAAQPWRLRMAKDLLFGNFFLMLCLPMVFIYASPPLRFLLAILGVFIVALALESWNQIHYFGPVIGLAAVLKMSSLRWLSAVKIHRRKIGIALSTGVILCSALNLIQDSMVFPQRDVFSSERAGIQKELESTDGLHVVLVRYADDHPPVQQWVYNRANIDASKVVWAWEMSDQENRRLFDYFKGRTFWLLEPDAAPPHLKPLFAAGQHGDRGPVSLLNGPEPLQEK